MATRKIFKYAIFASVLFVGTFLSRSYAQESLGLSISPPTFEVSANPGDTLSNTIRVTNLSENGIDVVTSMRNFTAVGEEGAVGLTEEDTSYSLAKWITIEPAQATVAPGANQVFSFKVNVPLNAEAGGHFGSIVFTVGGTTPEQTGAAVSQEVASLILLRIAGDTKEEAKITAFDTDKTFYEYGPAKFDIKVENKGGVHVKVAGKVVVTNFFGMKVADLDVEPKNVLPDASRRLDASLDKKWLIGKYTASAFLNYGTKGETMTATTTFVAFPYKVGSVVIAIALIVLVGLFRSRKRIALATKVLFGKSNG